MPESPLFLRIVQDAGTTEVQVWATAGVRLETADFVATYNTTYGSFVSFIEPAGWTSFANPLTGGTIAVSEADFSLSSPVANAADGQLGAFVLTPVANASSLNFNLTQILLSDVDGTSLGPADLSIVGTVTPPAFSWLVDASGDFSDPTRWGGGTVPGAATDAVIDQPSHPDVVHSSGTDAVHSLTNTAGTFQLAGGTLTASTLTNASLMRWTGGDLVLNAGTAAANFTNSGTLTLGGSGQHLRQSGSNSAALLNSGAIVNSLGLGETDIDTAVTNTGAIFLNQGTLSLNGGGSSSANALVSGGGAIRFGAPQTGSPGTFTLTGGTYGGMDTIVQDGTLDASGLGALFFGQLQLQGDGLVNLGTVSGQANSGLLQSASGTIGPILRGSGTFTVFGGGALSGGAQSGTGLTELVGVSAIGSGFGIDGGRTVRNNGWLNWSSGNIALGAGDTTAATHAGTLANAAGATFYVAAANGRISNGGTGVVSNAGVIAFYAGGGRIDLDASLNNTASGYTQIQSGTLSLNGGGTSDAGHFFAAPGATLRFG